MKVIRAFFLSIILSATPSLSYGKELDRPYVTTEQVTKQVKDEHHVQQHKNFIPFGHFVEESNNIESDEITEQHQAVEELGLIHIGGQKNHKTDAEEKHHGISLNSPEEFKRFITEYDSAFINFCAPGCLWCERVHPTWERVSRVVEDEDLPVGIATVNCEKHKDICSNIPEFPRFHWYEKGKFIYPHYQLHRTVSAFQKFIKVKLDDSSAKNNFTQKHHRNFAPSKQLIGELNEGKSSETPVVKYNVPYGVQRSTILNDSYIPLDACHKDVKTYCSDLFPDFLATEDNSGNMYYINHECYNRLRMSFLNLSCGESSLFRFANNLYPPQDPKLLIPKGCVEYLEDFCPPPLHFSECIREGSEIAKAPLFCRIAGSPIEMTLTIFVSIACMLGMCTWILITVYIMNFFCNEVQFKANKIQLTLLVIFGMLFSAFVILAFLVYILRSTFVKIRNPNATSTVPTLDVESAAVYTAVPIRVV